MEKRLAVVSTIDEPVLASVCPPLAVVPFDEKVATLHQERWANYLHFPVVRTTSIGMEFVLIPPGEFHMGSPDSDRSAAENEKPQHKVRLTKPFYMGKYLVTQEQWVAVMGGGHNPGHFNGAKNPVDSISWDDCQLFLARLNEKSANLKGKFTLPTEAQWEFACRAGSTTNWYSETGTDDLGWLNDNCSGRTHPVGEKKPNAWGLYDMHGNVFEWCQDWLRPTYYAGLTDS